MAIIKYTDKGFLREHPFGDPITSASPLQKHSHIFPGDEVLLYHKLRLPGDATGAVTMADIKFISAKLSVIAQKPQAYSEEYSIEYKSTRIFELDSFFLSFNSSNLKVVPWASDGYAPNMFLQQDRNWKLPPSDFRRQINLFTKHTSGNSYWDYWFYFPVLFRWEYWISLANVNNDFFDLLQPQNGQNQWWYHYFVANKWRIKSRLDLTVLIKGVQQIIRNDLDLTPNTSNDVNDYNSNADWTNKSIKTCEIGGIPFNAPAFVYGNRFTEVWGFLDKVSSWNPSEQTRLSAVAWIEPYEGAGLGLRTRASSCYPVGAESVFVGLDTSITDDSAIGVTTDSGQFVVTDANGYGVIIIFDAANPQKIKLFSMIDPVKLNAVYPGITKFTIYYRLYNSSITTTLGFDYTARGEEIRQVAQLIAPVSSASLCAPRQPACPFNLTVFADQADSDELKNDKSDFYEYGDASISNIVFKLQKNTSSCGDGQWTDKATITSESLGRFFAFGKSNDFSGVTFTDDYEKKYTGVLMEWRKVLAAYGAGNYRMKIVRSDVFGNDTTTYDQRIFCLKKYDCNFANKTVRIEVNNQGLRGSLFDRINFTDYAGGWYSQYRIKGVFRYMSSTYTKEFNQYGDSDFNAFRPIINDQAAKFILSIRPVPGWMDFILSTNVLQADEIYITDYNTANRHQFIKTPVMNDGDLTPADHNLASSLAHVDINLAYGLNNLRRRNSQ